MINMSVVNIGYGSSTCVVVEKREFEDICISALRYCLYRHSYILDSTLGFIERHSSEVMSKRVWNVMFHDVNNRLISPGLEVDNKKTWTKTSSTHSVVLGITVAAIYE